MTPAIETENLTKRFRPLQFLRSEDFLEEIANHLVADRGHADSRARSCEREDHPSAGIGLSGAGWPLDWEHAKVQISSEPHGSVDYWLF